MQNHITSDIIELAVGNNPFGIVFQINNPVLTVDSSIHWNATLKEFPKIKKNSEKQSSVGMREVSVKFHLVSVFNVRSNPAGTIFPLEERQRWFCYGVFRLARTDSLCRRSS